MPCICSAQSCCLEPVGADRGAVATRAVGCNCGEWGKCTLWADFTTLVRVPMDWTDNKSGRPIPSRTCFYGFVGRPTANPAGPPTNP